MRRSDLSPRRPSTHVPPSTRAVSSPAFRRAARPSSKTAQAPWAHRSPAAVAAAAGAAWGAEGSRGHPEEGDAAAATPTPAGRVRRSAREPGEEAAAARSGPRRPWCRGEAEGAAAGPGLARALAPLGVSDTLRTPPPALRHVQETEAEDQRGAAAAAAGAGSHSGSVALGCWRPRCPDNPQSRPRRGAGEGRRDAGWSPVTSDLRPPASLPERGPSWDLCDP